MKKAVAMVSWCGCEALFDLSTTQRRDAWTQKHFLQQTKQTRRRSFPDCCSCSAPGPALHVTRRSRAAADCALFGRVELSTSRPLPALFSSLTSDLASSPYPLSLHLSLSALPRRLPVLLHTPLHTLHTHHGSSTSVRAH